MLFLDEPTIGLDPQTRGTIWDYVAELHRTEEITVFVTTHYMDEAEHCDRIAIMNEGRIVALDTPDALKAQVGADRVTITTDDDEAALRALRTEFGLEGAVREGAVSIAVPDGAGFVPRLFDRLGPSRHPLGHRDPAQPRRRLPGPHRHDDPRRGGRRRAEHASRWRCG